MELGASLNFAASFLSVCGAAVAAAVSLNQMWGVHLARARWRDEKLDADAGAAVAAVNNGYVAPLRREKMRALLAEQAPPLSEAEARDPRLLAQLYTSWALALQLTPQESSSAAKRAADLLALDHPELGDGDLQAKVSKAFLLAKAGMPGTLRNLSVFISRVRPAIAAAGGCEGP